MSSKLRIRIGDVEIDYEGTEEFLKQELPVLLKTAMELHREAAIGGTDSGGVQAAAPAKDPHKVPALTTRSIAARIGAKSGSDLLLAAAGHLTIVAKKDSFTRQELLKEMQTASGYYKKSYSANFSSYLSTANTDKTLSETATNVFALSAKSRADLEKKLANP